MSKKQIPESLEKGMLRAKHQLPVFRDGTIRYDMSDVPLTHFKPSEIMVPFQKLKQLGYTHDVDGRPLESDSQMLEIFPQDFIIAQNAVDFFVRAAKFTDELLERFYNMEPYYCVKEPVDDVGQLIVGLLHRIPLVVFLDESLGGQNPLEDMRIQCSMPLNVETVMVMKMPSCFYSTVCSTSVRKFYLPTGVGKWMHLLF